MTSTTGGGHTVRAHDVGGMFASGAHPGAAGLTWTPIPVQEVLEAVAVAVVEAGLVGDSYDEDALKGAQVDAASGQMRFESESDSERGSDGADSDSDGDAQAARARALRSRARKRSQQQHQHAFEGTNAPSAGEDAAEEARVVERAMAREALKEVREARDWAILNTGHHVNANQHQLRRGAGDDMADNEGGSSDSDLRLIRSVVGGGARCYRLLRLIRRAFSRPSPCKRFSGVGMQDFGRFIAPILVRMEAVELTPPPAAGSASSPGRAAHSPLRSCGMRATGLTGAATSLDNASFTSMASGAFGASTVAEEVGALAGELRRQAVEETQRANALSGALDPAGTGFVSWPAFTSVFATRGRSKDPVPSRFQVVSGVGGHHHGMMSAMLFAKGSGHATTTSLQLPPSLEHTLFTGGHDGTVLEWDASQPGVEHRMKMHSLATHNVHSQRSVQGDTFSTTAAKIHSLCMLPGARLFASQAFGYGYVYDVAAVNRPLINVVRTASFDDVGRTAALGGAGRRPSGEASAAAKARSVDAPPVVTLSDFFGDITASTTSVSYHHGAAEPLIVGSNTGQIAIYSLRRSAIASAAPRSSEGVGHTQVLSSGSPALAIAPLVSFTSFLEESESDAAVAALRDAARFHASAGQSMRTRSNYNTARIHQLLDVPIDHSLLAVGNDNRGRHFMEMFDYEKMVPKLRLCRPGEREGGSYGGGSSAASNRVPRFTRVDMSPAHSLIIASGSTRTAALYTTAFPDPITTLDDHAAPIVWAGLDLSRQKIHVVTADKSLHIYDARMNRKIQVVTDNHLRTPRDAFTAAALNPGSHSVVCGANQPLTVHSDGESVATRGAVAHRAAAREALKRASPASVASELSNVAVSTGGAGACVTTEGAHVVVWPAVRQGDAADRINDSRALADMGSPRGQSQSVASPIGGGRAPTSSHQAIAGNPSVVSAFFNTGDAAAGLSTSDAGAAGGRSVSAPWAPPRKRQPLHVLRMPGGARCTCLDVEVSGRRLVVAVGATLLKVIVVATGAVQFQCNLRTAPVRASTGGGGGGGGTKRGASPVQASRERTDEQQRAAAVTFRGGAPSAARRVTKDKGAVYGGSASDALRGAAASAVRGREEEIAAVRIVSKPGQRPDDLPHTLVVAAGAKGTLLVVDITNCPTAAETAESQQPAPANAGGGGAASSSTAAASSGGAANVPTIGTEGVKVDFHRRVVDEGDWVRCVADSLLGSRLFLGSAKGRVLTYVAESHFTVAMDGVERLPAFRAAVDAAGPAIAADADDDDGVKGDESPATPTPRGGGVEALQRDCIRVMNGAVETIRVLGNTGHVAVLFGVGLVAIYRAGPGSEPSLEMLFPATSVSAACMAYDAIQGTLFVGDFAGDVTSISLWSATAALGGACSTEENSRRQSVASDGTAAPGLQSVPPAIATSMDPLQLLTTAGGEPSGILAPDVLCVTRFSTTAYISDLFVVDAPEPDVMLPPPAPTTPVAPTAAAAAAGFSSQSVSPSTTPRQANLGTPPMALVATSDGPDAAEEHAALAEAVATGAAGPVVAVGLSEAHCVLFAPAAVLADPFGGGPPDTPLCLPAALGASWRGLQTAQYTAASPLSSPTVEAPARKAAAVFRVRRRATASHALNAPDADFRLHRRSAAADSVGAAGSGENGPLGTTAASASPAMQPMLVVTADALDNVQKSATSPHAPSLAAMAGAGGASPSRPASVAGSVSHHSPSEESFSMAAGSGRTAAPCGSVLKFLTVAGRQKAERSWKGTLTPRGTTLAAPRLLSKDLSTAASSRPSSARQPTPRTPRPPTGARRNSTGSVSAAATARHPSEAVPLEPEPPRPEEGNDGGAAKRCTTHRRPSTDGAAGMFTDNDEAFERLVNEQGDDTERRSDLARVVMSAADLQREIVTAFAKSRRSNSSVQQELIASALLTHSDVPAPNDPAAMAVAAAGKGPSATAAASVARSQARRSHSARTHRHAPSAFEAHVSGGGEGDDDDDHRRRRPHLVASAHLISTPRMRKSEHIHYARPPKARDDLTPRAVHLATPPTAHSTVARPTSPNFARKDGEAARLRAEEYRKNAATVSEAVSRSQDVAALALTQQRAMRRNRLGGAGAGGGKGLSFRCLDVPAVDAVAIKTATTPHGGQQHKPATVRTTRLHQ